MLGQIVRYKLTGLSKTNDACYILCPATQAKFLLMATMDILLKRLLVLPTTLPVRSMILTPSTSWSRIQLMVIF